MSEKTRAEAEVVKELTQATMELKVMNPEGSSTQVALIPNNMKIEDLDCYLDRPKRIKEKRIFNSLDSFSRYVSTFKNDETVIFTNPEDDVLFYAIIDHHGKNNPSWCDHNAGFTVIYTSDWRSLLRHNKDTMSQREFMNFINDHIELIDKPDSAQLLEEIKDIKVERDNNTSAKVTHGSERHTSDGGFNIPTLKTEIIEFVVAPARFSKTYRLKARLFVLLDTDYESPRVKLKYSLINNENIVDDMVDDFVEQVNSNTGIEPYI